MFHFFESEQEKAKRERLEWVLKQKADEKYRQPLLAEKFSFPVENAFDFSVLQDAKEIKLHTYMYPPTANQSPRGVCVIFHGLNCHVGRNAHIAHAIAQIGLTVVGFDHRGFGKSQGIRGYLGTEEEHIQDSLKFIEIVESKFPKLPLFLTGLSMGGQTCFQLAVRDPQRYAGIILHAPAIKDLDSFQAFGKMIVKVIGFIAPTMPTIMGEGGSTSKNPYVDESYRKDPYVYNGKIIPGTIRAILNMSAKCQGLYERLNTPFLVIMGGIDKMVHPDLGEELIRRSPAQDKELLFYQNMWHNVWCEPEIEEILPKVVNWIDKRIA